MEKPATKIRKRRKVRPELKKPNKDTRITPPYISEVRLDASAMNFMDKEDPDDDLDESDLQFINDLIDGATKIVIYRKKITATIEFNHKEE